MPTADGEPDTPPPPERIVVPDDASALEGDRLAWLAEQRAVHGPPLRGVFPHHQQLRLSHQQFRLPGLVVTLAIAVVATVCSLVAALSSRVPEPLPAPAPVASSAGVAGLPPASAPGVVEADPGPVVGHLLPDVRLSTDSRPTSSTQLRPAVLLLLPDSCGCDAVVRAVYRQAREFSLAVWLIGAGPAAAVTPGLIALDESAAGGGARWAVDEPGSLGGALATRGITLVLVRADGVITAVRRDVPLDPAQLPALEPTLAGLTVPRR